MRHLLQDDMPSAVTLKPRTKAQKELLRQVLEIITNRHFAIVSPSRSFPYHANWITFNGHVAGRNFPVVNREAEMIYRGDASAARLVGCSLSGGKEEFRWDYNTKAWSHLYAVVGYLGFRVIVVETLFKEKGSKPGREKALLLTHVSDTGVELTLSMVRSIASGFNQDAFVYSGPETGHEITLRGVNARMDGGIGLPCSYGLLKSIKGIKTPTNLQSLIRLLFPTNLV